MEGKKVFVGNISIDIDNLIRTMVDINDEIIGAKEALDNFKCSAADCSICFGKCGIHALNQDIDRLRDQRQAQENIINGVLDHYITWMENVLDTIYCRATHFVVWIEDDYTETSERYTRLKDIPTESLQDICRLITFDSDDEYILCNRNDC